MPEFDDEGLGWNPAWLDWDKMWVWEEEIVFDGNGNEPGGLYLPISDSEIRLPKEEKVAMGPGVACVSSCKERAKLHEKECDKLRARILQALKDGHCPSKISGVKKSPCSKSKR